MARTKSASICSGSVISCLLRDGLEAALLEYPELLPHRPLLEEIAQVNEQITHYERMAADGSRRLDELGGDLEDALVAMKK
jgi:hypothetical protein